MQLIVQLKTKDLLRLDHPSITVTAAGVSKTYDARAGEQVVRAKNDLIVEGPQKARATYRGELHIKPHGDSVRLLLHTDLDDYVSGVLQSEVPAFYKLEAMKAQTVVARTYGLHPRLTHEDGANVCDSYLHCQAFYGVTPLNAMQQNAITSTAGEIVQYRGGPALAMFSACAGGHTENYEDAFSDPVTNAFPPPAIPYLNGVAEGGKLPSGFPDEAAMRKLYAEEHPDFADSWSAAHWKWRVVFTADQLESHMHHVVDELQKDAQFAPFIKPPSSGKFGHIKGLEVTRRGGAGTAMNLHVQTSEGTWTISKELTIRSAFANPEVKLKRLRSARCFFDFEHDKLGLIAKLTVSGFGSGHGVGMQQVGAQGWAQRGWDYKQICDHYFPGCIIARA